MMLSHSSRRIRLSALIAGASAAAIAALGMSSPASAHDTYVDHSDGSNSSGQCRRANPCATISRANLKAGPGDTIFVGGDPVAFTTPVTLGKDKSLVHRDFSTDPGVDTSGTAAINSGADPRPAITVTSNAGTIEDLRIKSQATSLEVHAAVKIKHDVFLEDALSGPVIDIAPDAHGKVAIVRNSIYDLTHVQAQIGILDRSGVVSVIHDNTLSGFTTSISTKGQTTISDNFVNGTHAGGGPTGTGIIIRRGSQAAISRNELYAPDTSGAAVEGILIHGDARLSNNSVRDYDVGIDLEDTPHPVGLTGDLIRTIAGPGTIGLAARDSTASLAVSDPHATNMTIVGSGIAISLDSVRLRLDSSIIGDSPAGSMSLSGGSTCKVTYSRGPGTGPANDGCTFQTEKDPLFEADGFHLSPASPLIDKGNPAPPPSRARDLDGDRRALGGPDGGNCNGSPRRDIGADEYAC